MPDPSLTDLQPYRGLTDPPDRPDPADLQILVAALREGCPWLVTFNVRHDHPGHSGLAVLRPGDLLLRVRDWLARGSAASRLPLDSPCDMV